MAEINLNRLIGMVTKMVLRSATDAGVNFAARRGKPEAEMSPEEREQARKARDLANRAKEVQKVTRRLWR